MAYLIRINYSKLCVFAIPFLVMSVFGVELATLYQYPEFQILRRVSLGGFIERVESTLSIQWINLITVLQDTVRLQVRIRIIMMRECSISILYVTQ